MSQVYKSNIGVGPTDWQVHDQKVSQVYISNISVGPTDWQVHDQKVTK